MESRSGKKVNGKKVVVIGAGLGGMSAAIQLASRGYQVDLFEKNAHLGGKLNVLKEKGFSFDLGPSIFTLPQMFRPVFEGDGKKLEDYIDLVRVDPQWRNFFEDGTHVDLWENLEDMKPELAKLSPKSFDEYRAFLEYSKQQYDLVSDGYFEQGLDTMWDFVKHYGLFAGKMDFSRSMSKAIHQKISHPKLQAIFEYFIKYVGASANDAPAFMNLMPNIQLEFGLWYIKGGLYNLAKAFEKRLNEVGVRVHLETEVLEMQRSNGKVTGLKVSTKGEVGRHVACDAAVSNMEVIPAYDKLLNESSRFMKKLEKYEPACSGIVLHLGTDKIYPQLRHHNFFYSKDQKNHFDRVFHDKKLPDDPTIYLVAPTRSDLSQAPEGCDNIKILPHIPYINEKSPYTYEDCVALKELVLDKLERMGLEGLRKHTVVEDFWTPFDIEKKYYSNKGSIYGVVSDLKRNFAFKAPKKSSKYSNLYFVGGSVNPGGGMPMVVLSGTHVAERLSQEI